LSRRVEALLRTIEVDRGLEVGEVHPVEVEGQATDEEISIHEQHVHLPYKAWCRACVAAKARDAGHVRQAQGPDEVAQDELPLLLLDYCFLATSSEGDQVVPILAGVVSHNGCGFAHSAKHKGASDGVPLNALLRFVYEAGLFGRLRVRTDAEPAIMEVAREFSRRRMPCETVLETTAPHSPQSKGAVEAFIGKLGGTARLLREKLQSKYQVSILNASPMFHWLVIYSAWALNRFQPMTTTGMTPVESIRGAPYTSDMSRAFGDIAMVRLPVPGPKLESRWHSGVLLGRTSALSGDLYMVGTKEGVVASRSIKLTRPDGNENQVFLDMVWKTWNLRQRHVDESEVHQPPPQRPDDTTRIHDQSSTYQQFVEQAGKTRWCQGCARDEGRHSKRCIERRMCWERSKRMRTDELENDMASGQQPRS
jgi:hypothetical protein